MQALKGAAIIGQSGGPTAVINASILGCIQAAMQAPFITKVYGAAHGIKGILNNRLYDLSMEESAELELLRYTPSAALGSCRYKLGNQEQGEEDYKRLLEMFRKYDIRYFFYNGGNDSMDTCMKIGKYLSANDYECRIIGIPKTIDNDLVGTDHCPGYGSAAKYVATTCMEVFLDAKVYGQGSITIMEIMGRDAGWLTAASALATYKGMGPQLIYLPEMDFDLEDFVSDVTRLYERDRDVLVCVSEGIKDKSGTYISSYFSDMAKTKDAFGHAQMGGLAGNLANFAKARVDAKVRGIELNLLQRCAAHTASHTDMEEAYLAGKAAFEAAAEGYTGKMLAFERPTEKEYACTTKLVELKEVANLEKTIPREWINRAGNGLLAPFIDYALPLIQGEAPIPKEGGLPRFAHLKKIMTRDM